MKSAICLLVVLVASCAASAQPAEPRPSPMASADRLFEAGEFAVAREQYARIVAEHPDDYPAILGLGRVALLSNRPSMPRAG
jgi:Tetratricopeptide repeat